MDLNFLKWQLLRCSLIRRVVLRAVMILLAVIVLCVMQIAHKMRDVEPMMLSVDECPLNLGSYPILDTGVFSSCSFPPLRACRESKTLTKSVVKELMQKNLLQSNARTLCVGDGSASSVLALHELGFQSVFGVHRHPFFCLFKGRFMNELNFEDNHFDFVYTADLDRVSFPTLLVLEIERVLRAGGLGVMLVGAGKYSSGSLEKSATHLVSFLKSSDVLQACSIGSSTLILFKKRFDNLASFEHIQLPGNCPSIEKNKPYMKWIEPIPDNSLLWFTPEIKYLPKLMNISSRNRLIYINIGAGEFAKSSLAKISKPYCSNHHSAFDVFVIDHKTSILSSFVTNPGITFIYHPALSGDNSVPQITPDEYLSAPMDEKGFEFVPWFKETVSDGDFVVLMMNTNSAELNILVELFKTGAICQVDELFLKYTKVPKSGEGKNLLKSLRKRGVYAHQWP